MPAWIKNGKLIKKCEVCGGDATFGIITPLASRMAGVKRLSKWWCFEHWKLAERKKKENSDLQNKKDS